jgi:hypothetical protein
MMLCFAPLFTNSVFSQQRNCGSMELLEQQLQQFPEMESERFEIENKTAQYVASNPAGNRAVVTIPVVFHIVWRASNAVENISDAQIISQMNALTKDFSLLNTDASKIPTAFKSIAADCGIKFALATRTPWGAATNGINRYQSSRLTFWGASDEIKNPTKGGVQAWDTKKYLNVWVCAIGSNILGYAQFPGGPSSSDGIVLDYQCVGVNGSARAPFNLGRTLTHEVGHWLNLYHVWGNGSCGDDLVSDTPKHSDPNYGCPTFPQINSCGTSSNAKMTMNFMDYTNDQCMFMFTSGQKARIQSLFVPGGVRSGFITTDALMVGAATATCGVPTLNPVKDLYSSSALISWTPPQGATTFNIRYKPAISTTWTTATITNTSYNITGLKENTDYEYQVQSNCYGIPGTYTNAVIFKTPISNACAAPQTILPSNIQYNSATIKWSIVPGASQYRFQFKRSTSTTWNVYTLTASSCILNISPNTTYQIQVAAICGTSTSVLSPMVSFTTPVAPPVCTDAYEVLNNNTMTAASAITANVAVKATISSTTDQDWFYFNNSVTQPHIQVALSNLKVNYGINLYNEKGVLLATSNNIGAANEVIKYNNGVVGKYYIQVFNNAGSNDTYNCYSLLANTGAAPYTGTAKEEGDAFQENTDIAEFSDNEVAQILSWEMGTQQLDNEQNKEIVNNDNEFNFKVFPNPISNNAVISINTKEENTEVEVSIFDSVGRIVYENKHAINSENNKLIINMFDQQNGLYLVRVKSNTAQQTQKVIVRR